MAKDARFRPMTWRIKRRDYLQRSTHCGSLQSYVVTEGADGSGIRQLLVISGASTLRRSGLALVGSEIAWSEAIRDHQKILVAWKSVEVDWLIGSGDWSEIQRR